MELHLHLCIKSWNLEENIMVVKTITDIHVQFLRNGLALPLQKGSCKLMSLVRGVKYIV